MDSPVPRSSILDHVDALIATLLGVLSLGFYVRTLVPGLIPNDSAEFQTLAYTLDHAHTTGYEVYTLLARVFTLLPVGDMAYRVNLFSAFCAALTVACVYLAGRVLSGSRWAGAFGALALAVSATFWSQAIIAEVYTPGSAFTGAVLLLVLLWYEAGSPRLLFAAGLLGGLAVSVHSSNSLFAPAVGVLVLLRVTQQHWVSDVRRWLVPALGGALLGLALMLAAFTIVDLRSGPASTINAVYRPSISRWDMQPADLDSFTGRFSYLVFARQWRSAMFTGDDQVASDNFARLTGTLPSDFAGITLILMTIGFFGLFERRWRLAVFFLVALLVHLTYTLNYRIGDIYVFYISLYVYTCVLAAEGAAVLLRGADRLFRRLGRSKTGWVQRWKPWHAALALLLIFLALQPFAASRLEMLKKGEARWPFMGLDSNQKLAEWRLMIQYTVQGLPPNAIVLMDWHDLYGYFYVAEVEQGRWDLQFIETYPYAVKEGIADSLLAYLRENLQQGRPVLMLRRYEEVQRGGFSIRTKPVGISRMYSILLK